MPTGYTADVADGKVTDFRTFALRCARAFSATIMQRDNPLDELPKHREPSDYNARELVKTRAEVERLAAMTEAEARVAMEVERAEEIATTARYNEEETAKRARCEAMLAEVKGWIPPTADHVEMRDFMVRQLAESIGLRLFAVPGPRLRGDARRMVGGEAREGRA